MGVCSLILLGPSNSPVAARSNADDESMQALLTDECCSTLANCRSGAERRMHGTTRTDDSEPEVLDVTEG